MNGNVTNIARTFALSIAFESVPLRSLRYWQDLFFSFLARRYAKVPTYSAIVSIAKLGRLPWLSEHDFLIWYRYTNSTNLKLEYGVDEK